MAYPKEEPSRDGAHGSSESYESAQRRLGSNDSLRAELRLLKQEQKHLQKKEKELREKLKSLQNIPQPSLWADFFTKVKTRFRKEKPPTVEQLKNTRLIAFYLPQFHCIPENDEWWGSGFTEWTNVKRARSFFDGHKQPLVPSELGYYDLKEPDIMNRQAQLAREHGISGFCFYYYWFRGRRLLEAPLEEMLRSKTPNFPFCICWANENWTRSWDGKFNDVLIDQNHSVETDAEFIHEVIPILKDERYIRVDGKPLLIVYRPELMADPLSTTREWREHCRIAGIGEIQLCTVLYQNSDPKLMGFDAAIEFPPHSFPALVIDDEISNLDPEFRGEILDYSYGVDILLNNPPRFPFKLYRGVMPGWDNTPRRMENATVFYGNSPSIYQRWLNSAIANSASDSCENLIFINAWNEWAEGACLEPSEQDGRAYLEKTREVMSLLENESESDSNHELVRYQLRSSRLASFKKGLLKYRFFVFIAYRFPRLVRLITRWYEGKAPSVSNECIQSESPESILYKFGNPIKVVFVTHDYALAGAQKLLLAIVRWLHEHSSGIEFCVLSMPEQTSGALRIEFEQYCKIFEWSEWCTDGILNKKKIEDHVGSINCFFCNTIVSGEVLEQIANLDTPIITYVHELETGIKQYTTREAVENVRKYSSLLLAASPSVKENLIQKHGFGDTTIEVVYPFLIQTAFLSTTLSEPQEKLIQSLVSAKRNIVYGCGTPGPRKGTDLFVEVAEKSLKLLGKNWCFVWVGDYDPKLDKLIKNKGLQKQVILFGCHPNPKELFGMGKAFCLTSREDPFPIAAIEAASERLPILCFKETGGIPDFVTEYQSGIVCKKESVSAMSDALIELAGNTKQQSILGSNGKRAIHGNFTSQTQLPRICKYIETTQVPN